jgi:hypothetical protein
MGGIVLGMAAGPLIGREDRGAEGGGRARDPAPDDLATVGRR